MFSSWFTFRKWTHKAAYVHALDVRVENSKILQFLGPNIRWHQWRSRILLQILNVHERLHSCTFIFWTYVNVRLRLLQHLDVRVRMAKDRRLMSVVLVSLSPLQVNFSRFAHNNVNLLPLRRAHPKVGVTGGLRLQKSKL